MDTSSNADSLASQYALQVALQTLKERTIALQRRLTLVEDENRELREQNAPNGQNGVTGGSGGAAENFQLRLQVADLQRQKAQLSEHIVMVSNENRKLWSRLSQMAKEQGKTVTATETNEGEPEDMISPRSATTGANQNLIRSKTFTQHSPNPNLRHKLIANDGTGEIRDISLEEVALNAYQHKDMGAGEEYADAVEAELDFAYLNVEENGGGSVGSNEADFNLEAKKCIEGLQDMRREAMRQQRDLSSALTVLESRIALQPCPECAKKSQKPEMADKSLETDESLNEVKFYNDSQIVQPVTLNGHNTTESPVHLNIIQEKNKADALDKTCPMCGKIYAGHVTFNAFREHVEMHFVDDSMDAEASMDRNFEFISHAVGDF